MEAKACVPHGADIILHSLCTDSDSKESKLLEKKETKYSCLKDGKAAVINFQSAHSFSKQRDDKTEQRIVEKKLKVITGMRLSFISST